MIETSPPTPFKILVYGLRVGTIVVAEQLDPDGDRRLPVELRIIARAVGKTMTDVEQGMRERRLITTDNLAQGRQRLAAKRERRAVVKRPATKCQQRRRRIVRRHDRRGRAKPVLAELAASVPSTAMGLTSSPNQLLIAEA